MNYKIGFWVVLSLLALFLVFGIWSTDKFAKDYDVLDKKLKEIEESQMIPPQPPQTNPESSPRPLPSPTPQSNPEVILDKPKPNTVLPNKVDIVGRAMGSWFFEGNIVCKIMDGEFRQIASAGCQATESWEQAGYVHFKGTLYIRGDVTTTPINSTGYVVIQNDNPSGDPNKSKEFKVPVRFK